MIGKISENSVHRVYLHSIKPSAESRGKWKISLRRNSYRKPEYLLKFVYRDEFPKHILKEVFFSKGEHANLLLKPPAAKRRVPPLALESSLLMLLLVRFPVRLSVVPFLCSLPSLPPALLLFPLVSLNAVVLLAIRARPFPSCLQRTPAYGEPSGASQAGWGFTWVNYYILENHPAVFS